MTKPYLIKFGKLGEVAIGYISVCTFRQEVPFEVKRLFWTYHTPGTVIRGKHAHKKTEQVLIAIAGKIVVKLESNLGEKHEFELTNPNEGVYVPPNCWHTMQYSHDSVQLVLASTEYNEDDYIRDYETFKSYPYE